MSRAAVRTSPMLLAFPLLLGGCLVEPVLPPTDIDDAQTEGDSDGPEPAEAVVDWPTLDCDPLVPSMCGYPFPNNVFTEADANAPTGRALKLSNAMLPLTIDQRNAGADPNVEPGTNTQPKPGVWGSRDGFSVGSTLMAQLPGATETGLALSDDIARSLADDSPTVLLDARTGERVPHFAEIQREVDAAEATFFIRPAVALTANRRYIAAIRNVVDSGGEALEPSEAFAQLRDEPATVGETDTRALLYVDIFATLGAAGVARNDLQLAWDFTTASKANNTSWLSSMAATALDVAGDIPPFEITSVEEDPDPRLAYRIEGTFDVAMFLNQQAPPSRLVFSDNGVPAADGVEPFAFTLLIPASARDTPAGLLQYGHGLLGSQSEIERDHLIDFMDTRGYAMFACDWLGLAEQDEAFLGSILASGRLEEYQGVFGRTQQAMVNALVLNRVVARGIATDDTYGPLLDPTSNNYYGISLGGILGTLYMALSTDVRRGATDVMGAPFVMLLTRSRQFDPFFTIANVSYSDPRDVQLAFALLQNLWDRAEPVGFLSQLRDSLNASGDNRKELLMRAALGDHSVPTVGAAFQARSLGAPLLDTGVRDIFGLATVDETTGLAYAEYDFGLPEAPVCPIPMRACQDPHGGLRGLPAADDQLDTFLRTGAVTNACDGGTCSFPELSGCEPGEGDEDVCAL